MRFRRLSMKLFAMQHISGRYAGLAGACLSLDACDLALDACDRAPDPASLPAGETGRRDYRLTLPQIEDAARSGTTPAGLTRAVDGLSDGALAAVPLSGPWSAQTLAAAFETAAALSRPVTLVANIATRHLWGSRASAEQLLAYLLEGELDGPDPDWDVGHFVCAVGRVEGPAGSLYVVADTYPSLGNGGVYAQPAERLALALQRPPAQPGASPEGGMLAVADARDAATLRAGARAAGLREALWDNGTLTAPLAA